MPPVRSNTSRMINRIVSMTLSYPRHERPRQRPTSARIARTLRATCSERADYATMPTMRNDVIELVSALVAIDSVNPSLMAGGAGESEIAAFIVRWAREAGLQAEVLEATPGRPTVLLRAKGTGGGRTLLLCGHI